MAADAEIRRVLCTLDELAPTGCKEFRLGRGDWPLRCFVVQTPAGVRAYVNRCAHLRLPLNYMPDKFFNHDDSLLQCYVHGALFRKEDGYCVAGPCGGASLASVPVVIEGATVLLAPGVDADEFAARYD